MSDTTTANKERVRPTLSAETRQRITELMPITGQTATAIITTAVALLHERKVTLPVKPGTDYQQKDHRLSRETLDQIEREQERLNLDSRGKVIDMAVLFYSRHAKTLRKAQLEKELAKLQ